MSLSKDAHKASCRKILLIKLWGLGNLAVLWPLVNKIKESYPNSLIFFLTLDLNKNFIEKNSAIYKVIYFKFTKNIFSILAQCIYLLRKLRKEKLDIVINFETQNNASAIFSYLTNATLRIGLNNRYEKMFYNHWLCNEPSLHISQLFSNLLKPLGINSSYRYGCFLQSKEEKHKIAYLLKDFKDSKYICIHPGNSENFKKKRWDLNNFADLSNMLIKGYDIPLIFTGSAKEKKLIENIVNKITTKDKIFNLAGSLGIWELVELLRAAFLFISNDTGPVHIAAALGVNTVVFYGPTSPDRYGPLNTDSMIFYKDAKCSPCVGVNYTNAQCRNGYKCLDFNPRETFLKVSEKFLK
ncbi:MAG: glycosyltransferase family 9 protein [Candidatus Omnitrophota bacterium]|nr:glycosyltransferase family 9 protein [Candidatus Omnitrophota bacterium]